MKTLRRVIHPEVKIVDAKRGIVDYIASDESVDSYREIIRAAGWRFSLFKKNAPLVNSHDYSTIENLVGKVLEFEVKGKQLVERAQWAIDVSENKLAQIGWRMTEAGYLKAVSVGFWPVKSVSKWDQKPVEWVNQLNDLGLKEDTNVRTIYTEQEQVELSVVILGANPNALAKSYKAGVLDDADLEYLALRSAETISQNTEREPAGAANRPDAAALAKHRARQRFLEQWQTIIKKL